MSDLGHGSPDAAGNPEDGDGLARRQLCGFHRSVPGDDEVDADGGGFVVAEPFGFAHQGVHGHCDEFRV